MLIFLFNLKCIAPVQHNEPLHQPVPCSSNIPDATRSLIIVFMLQIVITVEEENILIYIAGYNSYKITKKVCGICAAGLVGVLNKANSSHVFFAAKQYQDLPTDGHVVPSSDSREVFTLIEAQFRNNVEKILHMSKVRSILVTLLC